MSEKKILLADDDKVFTTIIGELLKKQGYEVCIANNGKEALESLETFKADLIIMDVLMPGLTGYEALQKMKSRGITSIPMIVTSSNRNMKDYFENWEIAEFMTKPFEPDTFLAKLDEILAAQELKLQGEILRKQRADWIHVFAPGLYALNGKKVLLVSGKEFGTIQVRSYLECAGVQLTIAVNDREIRGHGTRGFVPEFILFEWHSELELGISGLPVFWEACQKTFDLKRTPYLIYYESNVDFVPFSPGYPMISYFGHEHLVKGIARFLSRPQRAAG